MLTQTYVRHVHKYEDVRRYCMLNCFVGLTCPLNIKGYSMYGKSDQVAGTFVALAGTSMQFRCIW